jgi:hypothetical protein
MQCPRCGETFSCRANVLRHLNRKAPCPGVLSVTAPKILAQHLLENSRVKAKPTCEWCNKTFTYHQGKYRHKKICEKRPTQTIDALTREVAELKAELRAGFDELKSQAVPSTQGGASAATQVVLGTNNTSLNTANTFNLIRPWDPKSVDFESLAADKNNEIFAKAFALRNQVEELVWWNMIHKPPKNYSVYITEDGSLRFFDGRMYKRMEDPGHELDQLYDTCYDGLVHHAKDPNSRHDLDRWCITYDTDYDAQMGKLEQANDKENRREIVKNRIRRCAPDIKKVIDAHGLQIEE